LHKLNELLLASTELLLLSPLEELLLCSSLEELEDEVAKLELELLSAEELLLCSMLEEEMEEEEGCGGAPCLVWGSICSNSQEQDTIRAILIAIKRNFMEMNIVNTD
jgi:hypothetical protein